MGTTANPLRGEVALRLQGRDYVLRPTFQNIVAVEERLGPVLALAVKASEGRLGLRETAALLALMIEGDSVTEEEIGAAILEDGLASVTPAVGALLARILGGAGAA